MTHRGQQARKRKNRLFTFTLKKDLKTPGSHRFLSWLIVVAFGIVLTSGGLSLISDKMNTRREQRARAAETKRNDPPKRKKVVPLTEEQYKKEKHYSFYNQLEQRSLSILGKEEYGGETTPPLITTPHEAQTQDPIGAIIKIDEQKNKAPVIDIPPIVLASTKQQAQEINFVEPQSHTGPVITPPHSIKPSNQPPKRLQTGSFLSPNEARIQRKMLEAQGFSPEIIEAHNSNGQTIYRVQIGPFAPNEIHNVKARLKSININFFETK